jgi:hypothetical protein
MSWLCLVRSPMLIELMSLLWLSQGRGSGCAHCCRPGGSRRLAGSWTSRGKSHVHNVEGFHFNLRNTNELLSRKDEARCLTGTG